MQRNMLKDVFKNPKPIIGMMHVLDDQKFDEQSKRTLSDSDNYARGRADGLLFENWGTNSINRLAPTAVKYYMEDIMKYLKDVSGSISLPFGFNILPLDYELAFLLTEKTNAKFVQIDTFVDRVITDYDNTFMLYIEPSEVIRLRRSLGLNGVMLFTNIQTKHYITLPKEKTIEESALEAIEAHSDALVVTGKATGQKTPVERLLRVKKVAGDVPVVIGSGLNPMDPKGVKESMSIADGAIVGTGLKMDGITENEVDEARVRKLMELIIPLRG